MMVAATEMTKKKRKRKGTHGWTRKKQPAPKEMEVERNLRDVYYHYGNEGALQNNPRLLREIVNRRRMPAPGGKKRGEIPLEKVEEFLSKQPSYTVHHRVRGRQFPRRKILVPCPKLRIDGDLLELRDLSPWNSGFNYALILIDAFTRYVWARPMKNKESSTTADALLQLRDGDPSNLQSVYLYTDAGREFLGAPFQSALKKLGIQHRVGSSEEFHCPFVERVIRTIKEKLFQAMTSEHTRRWVDLLPLVVKTYNQTEHSSLGMSPEHAREPEHYLTALKKTYPLKEPAVKTASLAASARKYKFKAGDLVRILKTREGPAGMTKGYLPNFSWEIFRIRARANTRPHDKLPTRSPTYLLEDLKGEEIEHAVFYELELVRVHLDQLKAAAPVREVLDQRGDEVLVWFQGHPKSDAAWVPRSNLV